MMKLLKNRPTFLQLSDIFPLNHLAKIFILETGLKVEYVFEPRHPLYTCTNIRKDKYNTKKKRHINLYVSIVLSAYTVSRFPNIPLPSLMGRNILNPIVQTPVNPVQFRMAQ